MSWFKLLSIGQPAPQFCLNDANGNAHNLLDYRGKPVILVFYPANFTPGCTGQLCMFRDAFDALTDQGVIVLGINPGKAQSHKQFADKLNLNFPLLCDEGMTVAKAYKVTLIPGLLQNRAVYGLTAQGVICFAEFGDPAAAKVMTALTTTAG
jgi:thioredoxin-dependent peroxiredoxin